MKRITVSALGTQSPRLLGLVTLLLCVTAPAVLFVSAARPPVLSFARAMGQSAQCRAAVEHLQKAVNAEAYAYTGARLTQCQVLALPEDSRVGRPQAINDSMQRKLLDAVKETAAAKDAARGCDTSRIVRPETSKVNVQSQNIMMTCYYREQIAHGYDSVPILQILGIAPPPKSACDKLANELDCADLENVEETNTQEETTAYVPGDLRPECLDSYLQFKAAEREYKRAHEYERELAQNAGPAGPRGQEMWKRARLDVSRTSEQKSEAERKLEACKKANRENAPCGPGRTWIEEESGYTSVWTRQGDSDIFDAEYKTPGGGKATTRNSVTLDGDKITIHRLGSSDTHLCTYSGTLTGSTLKGTYKCPDAWTGERSWSATITCN